MPESQSGKLGDQSRQNAGDREFKSRRPHHVFEQKKLMVQYYYLDYSGKDLDILLDIAGKETVK